MGEKIYDIKVAKEKIQHYCAIMDRCQFQVMTKLKSYGLSAGLSEDILVELIQNKFVDEERFARAYCSGKFKIKKWGKRNNKPKKENYNLLKHLTKIYGKL